MLGQELVYNLLLCLCYNSPRVTGAGNGREVGRRGDGDRAGGRTEDQPAEGGAEEAQGERGPRDRLYRQVGLMTYGSSCVLTALKPTLVLYSRRNSIVLNDR